MHEFKKQTITHTDNFNKLMEQKANSTNGHNKTHVCFNKHMKETHFVLNTWKTTFNSTKKSRNICRCIYKLYKHIEKHINILQRISVDQGAVRENPRRSRAPSGKIPDGQGSVRENPRRDGPVRENPRRIWVRQGKSPTNMGPSGKIPDGSGIRQGKSPTGRFRQGKSPTGPSNNMTNMFCFSTKYWKTF